MYQVRGLYGDMQVWRDFKEIGGESMKKYVCSLCGFVYDEAEGHPDSGIKAGTAWEDIPEDFVCPLCGASKDMFDEEV